MGVLEILSIYAAIAVAFWIIIGFMGGLIRDFNLFDNILHCVLWPITTAQVIGFFTGLVIEYFKNKPKKDKKK